PCLAPQGAVPRAAGRLAEGGDYTCYAQNTLGRDEMKIHVAVIVAAPQIKHNHKTHVTVTAGDAALLDCEAAGEPRAQIFWVLPSSERISSSTARHSLHANGSLSISQASLLDAGEYLCVARNPGGDDSKLYKLDVAAKPPIINGLHRNKTIMKVTAVRHSKKHIDCRAEGTPPPQIMWIMPDNIFLTAPYYGSRIVVHKNGTLEIRNIRPSDTGDFICVARNDGGETVLVVGVSGEPLSLHCLAEGSPRPRLAWTLPGGRVLERPQLSGRLLLLDNGTLVIGAASAHDAGNYLCRAHNLAGDSSLTIPVVVAAYAPRIMGRPPPAIHTLPGAAVQLHCVVLGIPKPEITWELPDHSVLSTAHQGRGSGGELLHPTGTLLLQNPRPSSSGTYRCTARNPLGTDTAATYVHFHLKGSSNSKPHFPPSLLAVQPKTRGPRARSSALWRDPAGPGGARQQGCSSRAAGAQGQPAGPAPSTWPGQGLPSLSMGTQPTLSLPSALPTCVLCDWNAAQLHLPTCETIPPKQPRHRQELEQQWSFLQLPSSPRAKCKSKSSNKAFAILDRMSLQRCMNQG
uniref:Immunoglobulin superfamily member 10 n=1 Tax=Serinus canaria TaxID=9135 RepID=A0A8C9N1J1_SERCA